MERLDLDTQHRIVALLDERDLLCPSLACKALHDRVRERCPEGITTPPSTICSSVERILWIKDEYPGAKPAWLTVQQWNAWVKGDLGRGLYIKIARHGSLEVLQWVAAQGCPCSLNNWAGVRVWRKTNS
jgi:hypothetical protein